MAMRSKIVAANWKMHPDFKAGVQLATEVIQRLPQPRQQDVQVVLIPPFIHLEALGKLLPPSVYLGAQNCHEQTAGAFTGEVSAPMLRSVGADFVLIGHSERRQYFGEDDALLAQKMTTALEHGLRPIFCCGESKPIHAAGQQEAFVHEQLSASLLQLADTQLTQVVIAYEPVWAIGTGATPTPEQVQAMHRFIRRTIAHRYGEDIAQSISILYGGSCNARNARTFFTCPDVDGGLIGGASLEATSFVAIVNSLE